MTDLPAEQRALLRAVIADPDADTPRLVYADWLEDAGDAVQAEYIRESVRLARLPADSFERPGLVERLTATLDDYADEWAAAVGLPTPNWAARYYRRGFVHTVLYEALDDYFADAPRWFKGAPVEGLELNFFSCEFDAKWESDWERFVRSPGLARLRVLSLMDLRVDDLVWNELFLNPALAGLRRLEMLCGWNGNELYELARHPHLAGLEVLDLGSDTDDRLADGLRVALGSNNLCGLRAIYFGRPGPAELPRDVVARLTERCGRLWGPNRPPPLSWC